MFFAAQLALTRWGVEGNGTPLPCVRNCSLLAHAACVCGAAAGGAGQRGPITQGPWSAPRARVGSRGSKGTAGRFSEPDKREVEARHLPSSLAAITLVAKQDASDSASSLAARPPVTTRGTRTWPQGEVRLVRAIARFTQGGWEAGSRPAD